MHRPPPTNYQCPNQEHLETHQSRPTRVHYVSLPLPLGASPPHTDPCPLSLVHSHMLCTSLPCEMEDSLCSSTYAPACHAALAPTPSPLPHPHCGHPHSCHCQPPSLEALLAVEGGQRAARAPFRSPHHLIHKGCGGPTPHATATTLENSSAARYYHHQIPTFNQTK